MTTSAQTNQNLTFPRDPKQSFDTIEEQLDDLRAQLYIFKTEAEKYRRRCDFYKSEVWKLEDQLHHVIRLTGFEFIKNNAASVEVN